MLEIVTKTNKMKIALLSLLAVLTFTGCTKSYPTVNQVYSALYTVQANQWAQGTDNGKIFYYTTLNIAELTQDIDLNGGVVVYLSFDDQTNPNPTYEALPEVIDGVAYGVVHTTGQITIDLRDPYGDNAPGAITGPTLVKVVLMQAQPLD